MADKLQVKITDKAQGIINGFSEKEIGKLMQATSRIIG
jgi:hypothetical protein